MLTISEVAHRCGVGEDFIRALLEHGVIQVEHGSPPRVSVEVTIVVNKVARLQRDLGVNMAGGSVILELLDCIEELERQLALRSRF